jgi:hypothetical protein
MKAKIISMTIMLASNIMILAQPRILSGEIITIYEPMNQDIYVAGGTVLIGAPIHGDLIVAGGTVTVNDSVTQDILMAGGTLTLNGYTGDDIRCAGGNIKLSNTTSGDLIITGGVLLLEKTAQVQGDLISCGGEVTVDGQVDGKIRDASGIFTLNGKVQDLESKAGKIIINGVVRGTATLAGNVIETSSQAKFEKDVRYWNSSGTLDYKNTADSKITFDPTLEIQGARWQYLGFATLIMVIWYLGTALLMIAVIQYLFGDTFRKAAETIKMASIKSLGLGFLFLIGVPVLIVLIGVTVVGIPLGILMLIGYVTVLALATALVAIAITHWIHNTYYYTSPWRTAKIVFAAFGIFIILKLIALTPFIGPFLMLLLACMTFGGVLQHISWKKKSGNLALT